MTIDIMMPFFGDPALFREAVLSVVRQSNPDWRLVVIDDRYPDQEPGQWLLALGDPRIVYVLNDTNLGVSGNFSRSLELVQSDHFVLMGCDDVLGSSYIEVATRYIDEFPDASYYQPAVTVIDAAGNRSLPLADRIKAHYRPRVRSARALCEEELAVSLLRGNWTYFPSICWRTSTVRKHGFSAEFEVVLDLDLQLKIVLDGGRLVVMPEDIFSYRRHEASVSSWKARDGSRFEEERRFFLLTAAELRKRGWMRARRTALNHFSSRLNAVTKLPRAIRAGDRHGLAELGTHILQGWSDRL